MKYRRIPKKNRKKLKSVDPFNTKAAALKAVEKTAKNDAPTKSLDEQPLTKAQKKLMAPGLIVDKKEAKKKKKEKNSVLREAEKLGLKKGRFETVERFVRRVEGIMYNRIHENIAIAKQGLAGRKQEEIDADYAKIDEKEKRKKEQEKREIQNKIKEAKKRREQEAEKKEEMLKSKEQRKLAKRQIGEHQEEEEEKSDIDDEEEHEDDDAPVPKKSKNDKEKTEKLSKKNRRKEFLKNRKVDEKIRKADDAILNAKEIVAFGERYDAPPVFGGDLKKKFEPLMAKAGQKTLLLHSLLKKGDEKTKYLDNSTSTIHEERQRVIEAYRKMKKKN
ncbi:unnamed protein product [Caenorhabditis bovis]|uniref:Uncharacterized protein n=1 Tax=Caenorhabditis bovis TaxID=2654633 RepID=A0A8S1F0D5_9PELO|nr:unnamed protein product [Caenorhabditis bovis]